MSDENSAGSVIYVTASGSSPLQTRLRESTPLEVRSVTPEKDLERVLDEEAEFEGAIDTDGPDHGHDVVAVVLELDTPERTRALLERIHERRPSVSTIVVSSSGGEALATAALRGDADEYVRPDADEDPVARIVETIRSNLATPAESTQTAAPVDGEYHRILANELPDEAFVIGADGTYFEAKVRSDAADLHSTAADDLLGSRLEDVFRDDRAAQLQACIDRALRTGDIQSIDYTVETTDGPRRYEARVVPIDERIDGQRAVVWLARDITERAKRERELQSRRDQLETLSRISTVIRDVIETLVEAPSRDAIEREVCDRLVDSDLYCGAWVAERTGDGRFTYRTRAGSAETTLERTAEIESSDCDCLIRRAVRTGDVQTETRIPENEAIPEPFQEAARRDGVESAIAVPISQNDSIYGVLTVLAAREEAFSGDERAVFGLLGETIGFTIMAVKNRQLLFADTVVELKFRIDGGDTFSFDLTEQYDCTCSLEWAGTTSSGRTVQYVTIDGLESETVLEEARNHRSIEQCRLIHDGQGSCTIEIRLSKSGVRTLTNHGATIRDVTVEDGVGVCLIEVSQEADVREIAEALSLVYDNTELVARREVDRPVRTAVERRNRILDQLTDRQLTTLRLAYYSGFFDWPRKSTGEEIADAMDISAPTMHQHLRKGLKAVLGEFFEAGGGTQ